MLEANRDHCPPVRIIDAQLTAEARIDVHGMPNPTTLRSHNALVEICRARCPDGPTRVVSERKLLLAGLRQRLGKRTTASEERWVCPFVLVQETGEFEPVSESLV